MVRCTAEEEEEEEEEEGGSKRMSLFVFKGYCRGASNKDRVLTVMLSVTRADRETDRERGLHLRPHKAAGGQSPDLLWVRLRRAPRVDVESARASTRQPLEPRAQPAAAEPSWARA